MIESILNKAHRSQLWLGEFSEFPYGVSLGITSLNREEYLEKGYRELIINIDGVDYKVDESVNVRFILNNEYYLHFSLTNKEISKNDSYESFFNLMQAKLDTAKTVLFEEVK